MYTRVGYPMYTQVGYLLCTPPYVLPVYTTLYIPHPVLPGIPCRLTVPPLTVLVDNDAQ